MQHTSIALLLWRSGQQGCVFPPSFWPKRCNSTAFGGFQTKASCFHSSQGCMVNLLLRHTLATQHVDAHPCCMHASICQIASGPTAIKLYCQAACHTLMYGASMTVRNLDSMQLRHILSKRRSAHNFCRFGFPGVGASTCFLQASTCFALSPFSVHVVKGCNPCHTGEQVAMNLSLRSDSLHVACRHWESP